MDKIPRAGELMRVCLRKPLAVCGPHHPVHRHPGDKVSATGAGDDFNHPLILLMGNVSKGDRLRSQFDIVGIGHVMKSIKGITRGEG